jgi:hypothetical protein
MSVFALAEFWNEFYAAGGFWIGTVSLVIAVLGFWYTIVQVKKTQAAADAAKQAAESALAESKRQFRRFLTAGANRALGELRLLVDYERWEPSALRADDLADHIAQMLAGAGDALSLVNRLRDAATVFRRKAKGESAAFPKSQWGELTQQLHAFLDRAKLPFEA